MKYFKRFLIFGLITFSNSIFSQNHYDIIFPNNAERNQKCQYYLSAFKQKPKEVKFGIKRENNKLYFEINNKKWLTQLIKSSGDGIAVDIVSKTIYSCEEEYFSSQIKGMLLKPVYAKELLRGLKPTSNNRFRTLVGTIPEGLLKDDLEFNILFLSNKNLCQYYNIYNLESYPWDLLDMGVYLDSLTYKTQKIAASKDKFITKYKTFKFTIPFEKNKAEYSPEDIKPMYDSLQLTDYDIKKINIKAYASVEGSEERNLELQQQRANSIATSLQSFQKPNIVTEISSSENWVEFLNDISKTTYKDFKNLSKKEIKNKLVGNTSKELEVYLKNHRKAVITLELDKKDKYKEMSISKLVTLFNQSIIDDKLEDALVIQNSIFEKVKEAVSPDALNQMNIPKQLKYVTLLNKNSVFKYLLDVRNGLIVYNELKALEKLDPKNKRIKYNLTVLKFTIWRYNWLQIKESDFKSEITNLQKYGIKKPLIDRMFVNFHIVKAEKNMRERKYAEKDKSVDFILETYKNFLLSDYDYLSLAQFLTFYSKTEDAAELLDEKARSITIDEDLLFYYLNLTLIDKNSTNSDEYRTIMLNAINQNKERFCKLFDPSLEGGVTFQLLENKYLKKTYCENCNN